MDNKSIIAFENIIDALLNNEIPFSPRYLHRFSDISNSDLKALMKVWKIIPESRKVSWLEDLEGIAESDTMASFAEVGKLALGDTNASVRELGIRLLWENNENTLIKVYTEMLKNDPDHHVQAAAANALGMFVYLGELDEIPEKQQLEIESNLIAVFNGSSDLLVKRRSIESLGYSSSTGINNLIRKAYSDKNKSMVASALFAMGRSENEIWNEIILSNLQNDNVDIQLEAVRASGNLEIDGARDFLFELLENEGLDQDVFLAAIWSLSQIGGEGVQDKLERLSDDPDVDDETLELIDSAVENLIFNNSLIDFNIMDIDGNMEDD